MSDIGFTTFFGDGERTFRLTGPMLLELERVTDVGIAGLFRRLVGMEFRHTDLLETIRLGLIGGGASPEDAKALVDAYVVDRPILETYPVALGILEAVWRGPAPAPAEENPS